MHLRRVLDRDELNRTGGVYAELRGGRLRVREEEGLVFRIHPGAGNHPGTVSRRSGVHVLDLAPHVLFGQHALLDEKFLYGPNASRVVVGLRARLYTLVVALVLAVSVRSAHLASFWAGSSQCS